MRLFTTVAGLRSHLEDQRYNRRIGLVPTMGALHIGHLSLLKRALAENDIVVVSIFVNPLQFGPQEDLDEYPRQLDEDCQTCERLGVPVVFAPTIEELGLSQGENTNSSYSRTTVFPPATMASTLCGLFRPGHFQGVATIVTKLFNIVQPTVAYFGEKDAQQLAIVRRLVEDLNIPVDIRSCATVREVSGLAYSSRNQYLSTEEKEKAVILFQSLQKATRAFRLGKRKSWELLKLVNDELAETPDIQVQYVELVHPQTLEPLESVEDAGLLALSAYIGSTRLIDNVFLRERQPIIAIDGPAGAGKSTVTRRVAEALHLLHLDTGAMYRAVTWLVMQLKISLEDEGAIAELVETANLELVPAESPAQATRVLINGIDVTEGIRSSEITANVSTISAQAAVRQTLVKYQQTYGEKGGIVAEGRDIGTNVFPDAELKIFLTASVQERARRRFKELQEKGQTQLSLEDLAQDIQERDFQDSNRKISPLRKAVDAIKINTDEMSIEEVTQEIIRLYYEKVSLSKSS